MATEDLVRDPVDTPILDLPVIPPSTVRKVVPSGSVVPGDHTSFMSLTPESPEPQRPKTAGARLPSEERLVIPPGGASRGLDTVTGDYKSREMQTYHTCPHCGGGVLCSPDYEPIHSAWDPSSSSASPDMDDERSLNEDQQTPNNGQKNHIEDQQAPNNGQQNHIEDRQALTGDQQASTDGQQHVTDNNFNNEPKRLPQEASIIANIRQRVQKVISKLSRVFQKTA